MKDSLLMRHSAIHSRQSSKFSMLSVTDQGKNCDSFG